MGLIINILANYILTNCNLKLIMTMMTAFVMKWSYVVCLQWDLVCDKKWYVATQQAVMMSGSMTVLIGGWLSDRYT